MYRIFASMDQMAASDSLILRALRSPGGTALLFAGLLMCLAWGIGYGAASVERRIHRDAAEGEPFRPKVVRRNKRETYYYQD